MQYVKVDLDGKAYTYGWTGSEPLKRGDRVVVPGNVVNPEQSVRTVLRAMPSPDYDVDKIVNILDRVHLQPSRPEPHDWDDLIGDYESINHQQALDEFDAFENYVAEDAHATRLQRWDGVDPSADAGDDRTFAEANPGVDLIGDLGDDDPTFDPSVHG